MKSLPAQLTVILSDSFYFFHLITIRIGQTTLYLTDNEVDFTDGSQTYLSGILKDGQRFSFTQDGELEQEDKSFELVDSDNTLTAIILNNGIGNSSVLIERIYVSNGSAYQAKHGRWLGVIEKPDEEEDVVTISAAHSWKLKQQINNVRTNVASQQRYYPNDYGFEKTPFAQRDIPWMRAATGKWEPNPDPDFQPPTKLN